MGSDHFPILIDIKGLNINNENETCGRPKLIMSGFDKEAFEKYLIESMSSEEFIYSNGAELYEEWYNRVICCLKAGAIKCDSLGNILKFDHQKSQIICSKSKKVYSHNRKVNKPW